MSPVLWPIFDHFFNFLYILYKKSDSSLSTLYFASGKHIGKNQKTFWDKKKKINSPAPFWGRSKDFFGSYVSMLYHIENFQISISSESIFQTKYRKKKIFFVRKRCLASKTIVKFFLLLVWGRFRFEIQVFFVRWHPRQDISAKFQIFTFTGSI